MSDIDVKREKEDVYMPTISERTKRNIGKTVGMNFDELIKLDLSDEIKFIESKNGKKITYNSKRVCGRGNPRLATGRYRTMEEVDARLKKIKNAR